MKRWMLGIALVTFSMAGCAGGAAYYATVPPPALRAEAYGVAPGPGYVWVGGYWGWGGGRYVWTPGYWGRPPRPRAVWVPGYWEHHHDRYRFRAGRWR